MLVEYKYQLFIEELFCSQALGKAIYIHYAFSTYFHTIYMCHAVDGWVYLLSSASPYG